MQCPGQNIPDGTVHCGSAAPFWRRSTSADAPCAGTHSRDLPHRVPCRLPPRSSGPERFFIQKPDVRIEFLETLHQLLDLFHCFHDVFHTPKLDFQPAARCRPGPSSLLYRTPGQLKRGFRHFCCIFIALLLRSISGVLRQAPFVVNLALQCFPLEMLPFQRHVAVRAVLLGDAQGAGV